MSWYFFKASAFLHSCKWTLVFATNWNILWGFFSFTYYVEFFFRICKYLSQPKSRLNMFQGYIWSIFNSTSASNSVNLKLVGKITLSYLFTLLWWSNTWTPKVWILWVVFTFRMNLWSVEHFLAIFVITFGWEQQQTQPKVMTKMFKECSTDQRFIRKRNMDYL